MSKVLLGMIIGTILGCLDGLSAYMTPEARPMLIGIVIGSTVKGLITGVVAGFVARRTNSMALAVGVGLVVGLGLSYLASQSSPVSKAHAMEIILPGMVVGIIAGFASQRFGAARSRGAAAMAMVIACLLPAGAAHASYSGKVKTNHTVEADVTIAAPPSEVFQRWATADGLKRFLAPDARVDLRPGGEYTAIFAPEEDPQGLSHGTKGAHILTFEEGREFDFEWIVFSGDDKLGPNGPPVASRELRTPEVLPTWVEIRFEPVDGGKSTHLRFAHYGFGEGKQWEESYRWFARIWPVVLGQLQKSFAK